MNTVALLRTCLRADRALRDLEAGVGRDHPQVAVTLNNVANAVVRSGPPHSGATRARALYVRAIQILERAHGSNDPVWWSCLPDVMVRTMPEWQERSGGST